MKRLSLYMPRLLLGIALSLGLVSTAMCQPNAGQLAPGQETYFDLNFAGGQQRVTVVNDMGGYFAITVVDSNDVTVGSCSYQRPQIQCTVTWTPPAPGVHRVFIKNIGPTAAGFGLTTSALRR
jgi:hypothetical protein